MRNDIFTYETLDELPTGQGDIIDPQQQSLKKCPFCAEQIQREAVKCRYCHEFLEGAVTPARQPPQKKWYFANGSIILSLLLFGPLALPLVWRNPRYKPATKIIITAVVLVTVLVASVVLCYATIAVYQRILDQLHAVGV